MMRTALRKLFVLLVILVMVSVAIFIFSLYQPQFEVGGGQPLSHFLQVSDHYLQTRMEDIKIRLRYWDYPGKSKELKTPHFDRIMTWMPYAAGLNNRRISLENAYVFAWLTNRTLVLPPRKGVMFPYKVPALMEEMFDYTDMRGEVPMITWEEWLVSPHRPILEPNATVCDWSFVDGHHVFIWPIAPPPESPEYHTLIKKYRVQSFRDTATVLNFNTSRNIFFPDMLFFNHFYWNIGFRDYSPIQTKHISKLIKDRVHFPEAAIEWAAMLMYHLPSSFAAIHYRRSDFGPQPRHITPEKLFNNTETIFEQGEWIYVCTDESVQLFQAEFIPAFSKKYHVVWWKDFETLPFFSQIPPYYVPMIEMLIAGQSRIFVGTMWSTFSGYIQRLRGYNSHIKNHTYYTTTLDTEDRVGEKWAFETNWAWDVKKRQSEDVRTQRQSYYDAWEWEYN